MSTFSTNERTAAGQRWLWGIVGGAGALMHLGTALLRLGSFFPYPKLVDFAAFYTGAWSIRLGLSPYRRSSEFLETLRVESRLFVSPPIPFNPPIGLWLLQPLTLFDFPTASRVWLSANLVLILWIAFALGRVAGCDRWWKTAAIFLVSLTFGPTFLDLTLGQTSILLLFAALVVGRATRASTSRPSIFPAASAAGLAIGVKLFPAIWLVALPWLRRWRLLLLAALAAVLALGLSYIIAPVASRDYALRVLPERISSASKQASLDDQSLVAWLDRLGYAHTFQVPGFSASRHHTVTWSPPWSVDTGIIRGIGFSLVGSLGLIVLAIVLRTHPAEREGAFYLWVLYGLLPLPHTERYNHVLLLPAMAWLWGRGCTGRKLATLAYFLAGLSRLNHVWAILLPAPWGPIASGFGLYAVLLLGLGIATLSLSSRSRLAAREGTL